MRRALLAVLAAGLAGFSPFEAEEENVRAGNARLREGDAEGALRRYDDAERAVGPRAEIDFDRGHAALRAGRLAEAEAAFRRAARAAAPPLASRALQNAGTVRAAAGDREGALEAFREALLADPANEDARYDLEVLLREREAGAPPPEPSPGPGARDAPGGGRREEAAPQPPPSPGAERAGPQPPPAPGGAPPPSGRPSGGEARGDGADGGREGSRRELTRQDAEALLDALRAGERNMPLFGRERKETRRGDAGKDW